MRTDAPFTRGSRERRLEIRTRKFGERQENFVVGSGQYSNPYAPLEKLLAALRDKEIVPQRDDSLSVEFTEDPVSRQFGLSDIVGKADPDAVPYKRTHLSEHFSELSKLELRSLGHFEIGWMMPI